VSLELTFARVTPPRRDDGARPEGVGVGMARLEGEAAVSNRRWYIGCAQVIAEGRSLSGDRADTLIGNPELWGRALWASREGLAFGGGLGFVPPLVGEPPERGASVAGTVRVVRPWDYPHFAGQVVVLRPFLDVRAMDGPIMLQLRQGIDMLGNATDRVAIPDTNLTSRTTLYLGYRPVEPLGIGLELWEVYFIKASGVADDERAVFALSPSVRWMTQVLQPALSMIFPIDRPLFHEAKDYWAIRLHIGAILDPSPPASDW
jgi:hypothetical protein